MEVKGRGVGRGGPCLGSFWLCRLCIFCLQRSRRPPIWIYGGRFAAGGGANGGEGERRGEDRA